MTTLTKKSLNVPKVKQNPLLQKIQWVGDPVGYLEQAAKDSPDIFAGSVASFDKDLIFVNHPEAIKEILTNDRSIFFASGEANGIVEPLVGKNSVITIEGQSHRQRRKLLLPPFHGSRMKAYGKLIQEITIKSFNKITPNKSFIARKLTQEISMEVILEAVYGLQQDKRSQEFKRLIANVADMFSSPLTSTLLFFPWLQKDWGRFSPWGIFLKRQQAMDKAIYEEIATRRKNPDPERTDILSLLLSAKDESGNPMTEEELRDELTTLLFAGHETTATSMAWALYWIYSLPEVKEKLIAEINSLGTSPDPMEISKLPYLEAVACETLRITPVAMLTFPRVVREPVKLLQYNLQPYDLVMGCIYLVHQREDLYPEPKQFKPERFLEKQFTPYEFIPFGGGSRRCIGEALAKFELKIAIATILQNYTLKLVREKPEQPSRRGLTLAPSSGIEMALQNFR